MHVSNAGLKRIVVGYANTARHSGVVGCSTHRVNVWLCSVIFVQVWIVEDMVIHVYNVYLVLKLF